MKLNWQIVRLQLKEKFSISYGDYTFRNALILSITHNGETGYGECTAINYYNIDLQKFILKLELNQEKIERQSIDHPVTFYKFLNKLRLHSFLQSALDCAYWDLFGKLENKSFLELNKISFEKLNSSSITISIAPVEEQLKKIETLGWKKYKIKCNHYDSKAIDLLLKTGKKIALDANGSFTVENCKELEENPISKKFDYVEQPLEIGYKNYSNLDATKYVNWMADEDYQGNKTLSSLKSYYNTINIKLVKVGGLTPALNVIKQAKIHNFKIMIGCMTESTVGISAGSVLVPLVDFVDLDGANLLANDVAKGSNIKKGKVILSEKPGLGISLK